MDSFLGMPEFHDIVLAHVVTSTWTCPHTVPGNLSTHSLASHAMEILFML